MSGGVDSSVAAALLVEQGYEVVGLTMQLWPKASPEEACPGTPGCCGLDALDDARRVAQALGIRHYVVDMRDAFQRLVIEPFCESYLAGTTPNPCLRCNTFLKFGDLLRRAEELGATHLATGHYARVGYDQARKRWVLPRGMDETKDQSYVLYDLSQEQLSKALFPLGGLTKRETREQASARACRWPRRRKARRFVSSPREATQTTSRASTPRPCAPGPSWIVRAGNWGGTGESFTTRSGSGRGWGFRIHARSTSSEFRRRRIVL